MEIDEKTRERFWAKVKIGEPDDCWEWISSAKKKDYGQIVIEKKSFMAHRVAYSLIKGEIPERLILRHTCDNPPCCNPHHLIPGTHLENYRDCIERKRTKPRKGKFNHATKLTSEDVALIKRDSIYLCKGWLVWTALRYDVSHTTIRSILKEKTWKDISASDF